MKTSLARRIRPEDFEQVIDQVRKRGDANRPEHLRLAPHRPEFVERRVRALVRKLGAGWALAFLVADYAYLEASGADPDEWTAAAQVIRIHHRVFEAGRRTRMSDSRVSQLRTLAKTFEPRPLLHELGGKPVGGRGKAASYALPDWLRAAYLVTDEGKPESTVTEPCTNPEQTLRPSVRGTDQFTGTVVPQSPTAPAADRVTLEEVKAIFDREWSRRYQGLRYEFDAGEERALSALIGNNHHLTRDELQRRASIYLATDGDNSCCTDAELRLLSGSAERSRHFCTDYFGQQHPVAMFIAGINRFGVTGDATRTQPTVIEETLRTVALEASQRAPRAG